MSLSLDRQYRSAALLLVMALCLALPQSDCLAEVLIEGDAEFNGDILVAQNGEDGTLTITAPTEIQGGNILVANDPGTAGNVIVDGGVFQSSGNVFAIGQQGQGSLEIKNGGRIISDNSTDLIAGQDLRGTGNVIVSGVGSLLDMPFGDAIFGSQGGSGQFTISDGARANHRQAGLGGSTFENTSGTGSAVITGSGSRWNIGGHLTIGTGELRILNGGQVHSNVSSENFGSNFGSAAIGANGSGLVVVEGAGTLWHDNGRDGIAVGVGGSGTVIVNSQAKVISERLIVGTGPFGQQSPFSSNGLVTIDGLGSEWVTNSLNISGETTGQVLLTNGGKLINGSNFGRNDATVIGDFRDSFGRLSVDGITTTWIDNSPRLIIGREGIGELVIQNGSVVANQSVSLGEENEGHGEVRIEGEGSRWTVQGLEVGRQGSGKIEILNGAKLHLSDNGEFGPRSEISLVNGEISSPPFQQMLQMEGTLMGSGRVERSIYNTGNIRINSGDRLSIIGDLDSYQDQPSGGRVDVIGGELEIDGRFYNSSILTLDNATLRLSNYGIFENDDTTSVIAGTNRIYAELNNSHRIILSGNSQTTFFERVSNQGEMKVSSGSVATFLGDVSGNGIAGGGTVFLEGAIFPGFSPGTMEFGGDVVLGDFSELQIELSDDAHDMLAITGNATLGGDLVLSALSALEDSTTLEILSAATVEGTFDSVPDLGEELGFGVVFGGITYNDDSVEVALLQQSADFNEDGTVNFLDRGLWTIGYGRTEGAELINGDASLDGDVDGEDFLLWQRQAQTTSPAIGASQAVPEPSSATLLTLAGSALLGFRRR